MHKYDLNSEGKMKFSILYLAFTNFLPAFKKRNALSDVEEKHKLECQCVRNKIPFRNSYRGLLLSEIAIN